MKLCRGQHCLWLVNTYLRLGSKAQIQELFRNLKNRVLGDEVEDIIMIGDFNVNLEVRSDELDLLNALAKELNLKIFRPESRTRGDSTLDFLIAHKNLQVQINTIYTDLSDHLAAPALIELPKRVKKKNIQVINRKLTIHETEWAHSVSKNSSDFLNSINQSRKRNKGRAMVILRKSFFVIISLGFL